MNQVSVCYRNYLKVCGNRQSTIESKGRAITFFIAMAGDLSLADIRYQHGEDFRNWLLPRNPKTVNLYLTHLNTFFNWCVKRGYLSVNPCVELTALPVEDKLTQPFAEEEVLRMFHVAFLRWKVLLLLGYCGGLRQGEALNLVREDFLFAEQMLNISSKKATKTTWTWNVKNRRTAYAPLPKCIVLCGETIYLHNLIAELFGVIPANQPYPLIRPENYQKAIAVESPTLDMRYGSFDRQFKKICKLALVKLNRFQGLRVTYTNKLRRAGYDLKQVQILLRDKSLATVARYYCHDEEKELVAKANSVFTI